MHNETGMSVLIIMYGQISRNSVAPHDLTTWANGNHNENRFGPWR